MLQGVRMLTGSSSSKRCEMADEKQGPTLVRDFSEVILTLDNVLIPPDKLSPTPSLQDGLDSETETDLRILGCELIQTAGILLKLPQVAMATGQVLFQRFYYSKSFVKHNMEVLAMACVNLASKIEEAPRRIRDVINVFHHVKQVRNGKTIQPLVLDQHYINLKNQVIKAERRVLKELGFCVHVQHPHKIIVMYLQVLECERNRKLVQTAWNYMNDSFRTDVFVKYQPEKIGCACIYLAARQLQIPLPNSPAWFSIFGVKEDEVQDICLSVLKLYARPKPNYDELEKIVNDAKKIQIEAKLKAKGITSEQGTPNSNSRPCTPRNVSPNPSLLGTMKKVKSDLDIHGNGTPVEKNHSKKRNHSPDNRDSSKSRSSRSHSSRSRSRSTSRSPAPKSRKYRSPVRKQKKDRLSPDRYKEKHHSHKHEKRRKRSLSRSRSRSLSLSPDRRHSHKKYYKDKMRYRSPEPHRRSHKHRNGHNSPVRDKYSKYYRR
ncbi:cyclin-L1-like [Liolophura sinensis]|uniref:cyclin-L1-like n=1 Tax=Liolophura sinensis TaxID=3198878 RepID=UPI0031584489